MISKLSAGLNEEETKELKTSYSSSFFFRKQLRTLLEKENEALQEKLLKGEVTSSPSWEREVLDILAEMRVNKKMLKYLK